MPEAESSSAISLDIAKSRVLAQTQFQVLQDTGDIRRMYAGEERATIIFGTYEDQPAVLKLVNDPRCPHPDQAHRAFLNIHDRGQLTAPALQVTGQVSEWTYLIMDPLPEGTQQLHSPLSPQDRQAFLSGPMTDLLAIKDKLAYRAPSPEEQKTTVDFCTSRFDRWRQAAVDRLRSDADVLSEQVDATLATIDTYRDRVIALITQTHGDNPLQWAYGLAKPDKFHREPNGNYAVTDAKLIAPRPVGNELATAVWADAIMQTLHETDGQSIATADVAATINQRIADWIRDCEFLGLLRADSLEIQQVRAMIAERLIGSMYADSLAQVNVKWPEAQRRLIVLQAVLKTLLP